MKIYFTLLTFIILFTGCSSKNAFDQFNMSKEQELSVSSLQSAKIISKDQEITGLFSAIYLNEVYPKAFNGDEYFFIYMYLKQPKEICDPEELEEAELNIKLNSKLPIKLKELPRKNNFSNLVSIKSDWNKYYIVAFSRDNSEDFNLLLENGPSSSAELKYQKAEQ